MNHYPSLIFLSLGTILGAVPDSSAIAPRPELAPTPPKFYVECHAFIRASAEITQDYGYHLRGFGYGEPVENGINVNLDAENIFLLVERKQPEEEKYVPLYEKIPLVEHSQGSKIVEYIPQNFLASIVVGYDIEVGVILIKHQLERDRQIQGKGGCLFVPLAN
ncbi:MAG: hypothetical protein SAJ37_20585 [Oscillatoria sp. PMC 1068.18]|nr:hypothetical protein [Oscillatoria sp. PMC 1076.18]MEC4991138.1 hypothetical protein [Oscillatoria sp. PMC 1068.18]